MIFILFVRPDDCLSEFSLACQLEHFDKSLPVFRIIQGFFNFALPFIILVKHFVEDRISHLQRYKKLKVLVGLLLHTFVAFFESTVLRAKLY